MDHRQHKGEANIYLYVATALAQENQIKTAVATTLQAEAVNILQETLNFCY